MNLETLFRSRIPGIANVRDNNQYVLAIPLIEKEGETRILFEVRGAISQAGDVCLPGGRMEEGEDPEAALQREMCEELLICNDQIDVIGPSDIFMSDWGRIIRPYVVNLTGYRGTFSGDEVAEIFDMPLNYFLENEPRPYKISVKEEPGEDFPFERISGGRNYRWHAGERNVYFYDYEEHTIWGLTARIMKRFGEIVRETLEFVPIRLTGYKACKEELSEMVEVEVKLRINNLKDVEAGLASQGFQTEKVVRETDVYFDNAAGKIRTGGQALRVRKVVNCVSGEELSAMTFKGSKIDTVSMARQELETTVGSGEVAIGLLEALGYHPVEPRVVKTRKLMLCGDVCACLDEVEGLGSFLELEIMAEDETGRPEALVKIENILGSLGYSMGDTTRRSYLSQLQGVAEL